MIEIKPKLNTKPLEKKYSKASSSIGKSLNQKLRLVGIKIQDESRENAKISPPRDPDRGGLEKSIIWRVEGGRCFIFVPDNSLAGKYAWIQHKHPGRGVGTIIKGKRAGKEFITRAVNDNKKWIRQTLGKSFDVIKRDVR